MGGYEFRRILLAVDRSPQSQSAVEVVLDFAAPGAEVHVIHAWTIEATGRWDVETLQEAEALVTGIARRLTVAGLVATTTVCISHRHQVAREIVLAADEFAADMVAMGSRGRSDLGGLLMGSVSHQVVARTHRPVLIVRAGPRPERKDRRILLALAGGDEMPAAVSTAVAAARVWRAEVSVLHVSAMIPDPVAWVEPQEAAQAVVDAALDELRSAGVTAHGRLLTGGRVASEIAGAAEALNADLIVMGSRRLGELRSLLTGATDHAVVHEVDRPVLIAERGSRG